MNNNSNIIVTSNRFNFSDVTLVTPEDGINYFNNTWTPVKTFSKQQELTGSGSIEIITESTRKTAQWQLYHFTGTITKDLTDNISMYICTIYAGYNATTLIPANTYNTNDCIDIMILTRPNTNIMSMDITATDNNSQKVDLTFTVNINVEQYCL